MPGSSAMPATMKIASGQPARPARSCIQGRAIMVEKAVQARLRQNAVANLALTGRYGACGRRTGRDSPCDSPDWLGVAGDGDQLRFDGRRLACLRVRAVTVDVRGLLHGRGRLALLLQGR